MAEIKMDKIQKSYDGKTTAVDNFNLDIADKEFIVFVGPSGCG
ncbi:MAG TPA: sugar ABC transporter ATP-binding protein, partial [Bacillales bacterium]|nr:sugar ABC transporter ATP-binding protein [Bacillales bacterium]